MTAEDKEKSSNNLFIFCNICDITFAKKHASKHKKYCKAAADSLKICHPFAKNRVLFAVEEILAQTPKQFSNIGLSWLRANLIFLHPDAMRLCEIKLGDCMIAYKENENGPSVCTVWPCKEISPFAIAFLGKKSTSKPCEGLIKVVKSLSSPLYSLSLRPKKTKSFYQQADFTEYCKQYALDAFVYEGYVLKLYYFGQICEFVCCNPNLATKYAFVDQNVERISERLNDISLISNGNDFLDSSATSVPDLSYNYQMADKNDFKPEIGQITNQTIIKIETGTADINISKKTKSIMFESLGGMKLAKTRFSDHIVNPIKLIKNDPICAKNWKTRSVLLYGPSGCGKTSIVEALKNEIEFELLNFDPEDQDCKEFRNGWPTLPNSLIHFDVNSQRKEKDSTRLTSLICDLIDFSHQHTKSILLIVVSTSNHDQVEERLRRRFDLELEISTPDRSEKIDILQRVLQREFDSNLSDNDLERIVEKTHGFTASDLLMLCKEAGVKAVNRSLNDSRSKSGITFEDVCSAILNVRPSCMREIYAEVPKVRWSDIGGLDEMKIQLKQAVEWPLKHPEAFCRLGIQPPSGVLMYGPPGCAKTMAAKAIATESGLNFLSIKGPELFSKWVGESERAVREVFRKARQVAPCIVFFDEIDALGAERSGAGQKSGGSQVADRVLAQLLTEMDGVQSTTSTLDAGYRNVLVVAATNRPDVIDGALLRPGRLNRLVYAPLPDEAARRRIFAGRLSRTPRDADVDVAELAARTDGYSGAEVCRVCDEAAMEALRRDMDAVAAKRSDFEVALAKVRPRTDPATLRMYEKFAAGVKL